MKSIPIALQGRRIEILSPLLGEIKCTWFGLFWRIWFYEGKTLGKSFYFVTSNDHYGVIDLRLKTKDQLVDVFK